MTYAVHRRPMHFQWRAAPPTSLHFVTLRLWGQSDIRRGIGGAVKLHGLQWGNSTAWMDHGALSVRAGMPDKRSTSNRLLAFRFRFRFLNSKFIYCEAAHTRYYAYEQSCLAHLYSSFFNSDLKLEIGNVFDNKRVVVQWYESGDWLGKIGCVGWAWVRASAWRKVMIVYFKRLGAPVT